MAKGKSFSFLNPIRPAKVSLKFRWANGASKSISTPIGIIIILACALLAGGILAWQWLDLQKVKAPEVAVPQTKSSGEILPPPPPGEESPEEITPSPETANWKTYRNKEYGFELRYPKDFILKKSFVPSTYHGADFVGRSILSIEFPELGKKDTNLDEAFLVISIDEKRDDLLQCLKTRWGEPVAGGKKAGEILTEKKDINGITFYKDFYDAGGMSQSIWGINYRTIYQNRCYGLNWFIASTDVGAYTPGTIKEFDEKKVTGIFNQIISTFRFIK